MPTLYNLNITIKDSDYDRAIAILAQALPDGWEEVTLNNGDTQFKLYAHDSKILALIKESFTQEISNLIFATNNREEEDWLAGWKKNFQPVLCGNHFVILPPWLEEKKPQFQPRIPIIIEPKNAFGTGQHETTALCLQILSDLYDQDKINPSMEFLDLGSGSGILAIACAKLGLTGLAIDNDQDAITNTQENAKINQVEEKISTILGSIDQVEDKKFDLILANILAEPLIHMANPISLALKQSGQMILSGLLTIQAAKVQSAYEHCHLNLAANQTCGEWSALHFKHN